MTPPRVLKAQAAGVFIAEAAIITAVGFAISGIGEPQSRTALLWAVPTTYMLLLEGLILWQNLGRNTDASGAPCQSLGTPSLITLLRGLLIAMVAGFLTLQATGQLPTYGSVLAWLPAMISAAAFALHPVEGFLAHRWGPTTSLGQTLEDEFDSLFLFILSTYLVISGRLSFPFMIVGVARYLFVFAVWLRGRFGLQVHRLGHSMSTRAIAGLMIGYLNAAIWPVFSPAFMSIAAIIFLVPFIGALIRDWLTVSGVISRQSVHYRQLAERFAGIVLDNLPVGVRLLCATAVGWMAADGMHMLLPVLIPAAVFLVFGLLGRPAAICIAATIAIASMYPHPEVVPDLPGVFDPDGAVLLLAFVTATFTIICGTGRLSVWQPERKWFRERRVTV